MAPSSAAWNRLADHSFKFADYSYFDTSGKAWWGVKEGAIDFVSVAEDVPAEAKKKLDEVKAGLKDGSFSIWKGPITDNTGKVQVEVEVEKDKVADDEFLGGIKFFVKGVDGKVPGDKRCRARVWGPEMTNGPGDHPARYVSAPRRVISPPSIVGQRSIPPRPARPMPGSRARGRCQEGRR